MRLPPNAKQIFDLRRAGRIPVPGAFGHVAILPDWNFETAGAYVIAPPNVDPDDLDFCIVAGLDVTIFMLDADPARPLTDLVRAVMRSDPRTINVVDIDRAADGLGLGVVGIFVRRAGDE